ncbi:hypothetical protein K469DRAFT_689573 [Zopfia rhizophila CBS 207.26]|uniref:Uncharacterized protein n=1 Tax=Zopfia rhizophila CBS 207.26 TaxID=1314779 RepID=A0A6A6DZI4_9PEZI|nr:hypothetical protein K469DRAFT_689573 [Zopfia rhizophila CBS 207.26]
MSSSTTFSGPWSKTMADFRKSIQTMPSKYKPSFDIIASDSGNITCQSKYLHVWETDSDIDNLIQLTQVICKVRSLATYVPQVGGKGRHVQAGTVIITEEHPDRDNFQRVCELLKHLTHGIGKDQLHGKAKVFGNIAVVRGVDNGRISSADGKYPGQAQEKALEAVSRINKAISRICKASRKDKIVWHHGPVVHFLNFFIQNTTSQLRSSFVAITIYSALDFTTNSIKPTDFAKKNRLQDLERLSAYLTRLNIFAVFISTSSQLLTSTHLNTYVYYWGYYINALLPTSLSRTHFHMAMDHLLTFCYRLHGASTHKYEASIVSLVQTHLSARTGRSYSKHAVSPSSYTKLLCRSAGKNEEIDTAMQLADAPFKPFNPGIQAFSRLYVGPGSNGTEFHITAPVELNFKSMEIRPCSPSPFRVWLALEGQDEAKVRVRTQELMAEVLSEVLRSGEGGMTREMPVVGREAKEAWKDMEKACLWALDGCMGSLPGGLEEKVKSVREMMEKGVWGYCLQG